MTPIEIAKQAASTDKDLLRAYYLGAVGIRRDGAIVTARNGSSQCKLASAHAERRLARKLDKGSIVFVVRVMRDGRLGNARPCPACMLALKSRGVRRVFYSVSYNRIESEEL